MLGLSTRHLDLPHPCHTATAMLMQGEDISVQKLLGTQYFQTWVLSLHSCIPPKSFLQQAVLYVCSTSICVLDAQIYCRRWFPQETSPCMQVVHMPGHRGSSCVSMHTQICSLVASDKKAACSPAHLDRSRSSILSNSCSQICF